MSFTNVPAACLKVYFLVSINNYLSFAVLLHETTTLHHIPFLCNHWFFHLDTGVLWSSCSITDSKTTDDISDGKLPATKGWATHVEQVIYFKAEPCVYSYKTGPYHRLLQHCHAFHICFYYRQLCNKHSESPSHFFWENSIRNENLIIKDQHYVTLTMISALQALC